MLVFVVIPKCYFLSIRRAASVEVEVAEDPKPKQCHELDKGSKLAHAVMWLSLCRPMATQLEGMVQYSTSTKCSFIVTEYNVYVP